MENVSKSDQLSLDGPRGELYKEEYLLRFAKAPEFVSVIFRICYLCELVKNAMC